MKLQAERTKLDELFEKRWSPRAFSDEVIAQSVLYDIFDAARQAPSSYNEQPWRFIIGRKMEGNTYNKIYGTLEEFNQRWSDTVPVLILACAKLNFEHNGKPNPHHKYDLGQFMAYLSLKAVENNIYVHQMAGFDEESARSALKIPEGFVPCTVFAMGYEGDASILGEELKQQEEDDSNRKSVESICFDEWGSMFFTR